MTLVKDAPRTSTTIKIRSDPQARISRSRDPFYHLMRRLFKDETNAVRAQKFLIMIEERQTSGNPIRTTEWEYLLEEFNVERASFYGMRNKLLGAGLITHKKGEYRLSGQFSKELMDLSRWWWTAVLHNDPEKLQP